eukprot:GFUD01109468.1.p1 GENE.GFUD01109468.1~~GFUD01109468.1.p1  ORF type:complete len:143 (+),score=38.18 GFUD01109468.1:13-441(+)
MQHHTVTVLCLLLSVVVGKETSSLKGNGEKGEELNLILERTVNEGSGENGVHESDDEDYVEGSVDSEKDEELYFEGEKFPTFLSEDTKEDYEDQTAVQFEEPEQKMEAPSTYFEGEKSHSSNVFMSKMLHLLFSSCMVLILQ